jgi:hypothetical protein
MIDTHLQSRGALRGFDMFWMIRGSLLLLILWGSPLPGAEQGFTFFESKVRPLLIEHCYECHSAEAKKLRGGLYLDSRPGWQKGGDSGPAIVPGDLKASLLVHAIRYEDENTEMPPRQKLPQDAIDILEQWVALGAPDPRDENTASVTAGINLDEGRKFWSFQPLSQPNVPEVRDNTWPHNEIDHFILHRLEEKNLTPAPIADNATLNRRLHIDLTGLPSTTSSFSTQRTITRLLSSQHYAERFARHWLDLARYADSTGGGASNPHPDAYRYRDFVIRSFQNDLPYDQFITRQLAGDLLPAASPDERAENLVATGFLVLGPRNYINDDEETFHMDGADEQLDTVGRVFLGMTVGCARCHDHKFDPIPMTDYYALAGIFRSTETSDPIPTTTNFRWNNVADPRKDPDGSKLRAYEEADAHYRIISKEWSRSRTDPNLTAADVAALSEKRRAARNAIPETPAVFMGLNDAADPADEKRRIRGNAHQPAETVARGFLQVTLPDDTPPPTIAKSESGRRELAAWISSPANPLTARVYVNRVWSHLMGRGLVPTVDNFGVTGAPPTHPELLDWLANYFLENNQSTKSLVRLIVSSRTYQLGAAPKNSSLLVTDPANKLFGRRTRRSLDAETLRDSILLVSGSLDLETRDRPFPAKLKSEITHTFDEDFRRSLYLPRFRNNLPELFETFDVANPATVVGQRDLTILSPQALYLANSPFMRDQSEKTARNLLTLGLPIKDAIQHTFQSTLGRQPTRIELKLALNFLDPPPSVDESEQHARLNRWTAFQQNLFCTVDFRFYR